MKINVDTNNLTNNELIDLIKELRIIKNTKKLSSYNHTPYKDIKDNHKRLFSDIRYLIYNRVPTTRIPKILGVSRNKVVKIIKDNRIAYPEKYGALSAKDIANVVDDLKCLNSLSYAGIAKKYHVSSYVICELKCDLFPEFKRYLYAKELKFGRVCTVCNNIKSIDCYNANHRKTLNRTTICKECHRDKWREHFNEYMRNNKEKRRVYAIKYRKKIKDTKENIK